MPVRMGDAWVISVCATVAEDALRCAGACQASATSVPQKVFLFINRKYKNRMRMRM
jgi:hypothetical protein